MNQSSLYRYRVTFEKRFVSGLMSGHTLTESLPFACWQSANRFAETCDGKTVVKPCVAGSCYIKSQPILEAI